MKFHAIQTGTVQVHEKQRAGSGRGLLRFAHTLLDRTWTDPLPILAWVIEHPEGILVVDTGETSKASESGYFPRWHPYFHLGLREQVRPEDEIGAQLNTWVSSISPGPRLYVSTAVRPSTVTSQRRLASLSRTMFSASYSVGVTSHDLSARSLPATAVIGTAPGAPPRSPRILPRRQMRRA